MIASHAATILCAFGSFYTVSLIPRFPLFFQDLLGGKPLLGFTAVVLILYPALLLSGFALAGGADYSAWYHGRNAVPATVIWPLITLATLQAALIIFAFFLPFIGIPQALSPSA